MIRLKMITPEEWRWALDDGLRRYERGKHLPQRFAWKTGEENKWLHQRAAIVEMSVARFLGYSGPNGYLAGKRADIGSNLQVKWAPRGGNLLISDKAGPEEVAKYHYLFVRGPIERLILVGWFHGKRIYDFQKKDLKNGGKPLWVISPRELDQNFNDLMLR